MDELDKVNEIQRLAKLSAAEYELERKPAAVKLEMRLTALDEAVRKERPKAEKPAAATASLAPAPPEPWPQEVNGCELLDRTSRFFCRFVVVDEHILVALTLWVPFTYLLDIAEYSPRLAILSATRRCGKTLVIDVLKWLVCRALAASNISPASVFRVIELEHPALLIDEYDALPKRSERAEEIRGLLNSGHSRTSAFAIRIVKVGDELVPKKFSTWAAIAIAAIGRLPKTWMDRSIALWMKRKRSGQRVERLSQRNVAARAEAETLTRMLVRWTQDNKAALQGADPALPKGLDDRAEDNWYGPIAIADKCGGTWPKRARAAARALSKSRKDSPDVGEELLADIKSIFDAREVDRITSAELAAALGALELGHWHAWGRARKPITQAQLAHLLKDFQIFPGTIRPPGEPTLKGYKFEDFKDAFASYIPDDAASDDDRENEDDAENAGDRENDDADSRNAGSPNGTAPPPGTNAPGADEGVSGNGIPIIPAWLKDCLSHLGHTDEALARMLPLQAREILRAKLHDQGYSDAEIREFTPAQKQAAIFGADPNEQEIFER
jgi:putative DNA primase/helicase